MDEAIKLLCKSKLHRSFYLPASSGRSERLRITYSDVGSDSADAAVVVFIGGLMGGRYSLVRYDKMAKGLNVRILTIDRPGFGGSDKVPIDRRLQTWLDTLPALLSHLNIPYASLACHSGGCIYLLNTLIHHRHLLHPERPHVTFIAPWVHPKQSGMRSMKFTAALPRRAIANFEGFARFVNQVVLPGFAISGRAMGGLVPRTAKESEEISLASETDDERDDETGAGEGRKYDMTKDEEILYSQMAGLIGKYMFAEDISGASDEALFILQRAKSTCAGSTKSTESVSWGGNLWHGYDEAVKLVLEQKKKLGSANTSGGHEQAPAESRAKLEIQTYHAASDSLVGARGAKYFDSLWTTATTATEISTENGTVGDGSDGGYHSHLIEDAVEYSSTVCQNTTHDSVIVCMVHGMVWEWLNSVRSRWIERPDV